MLDSLKEELRGYDVNIKTISDIENNNIYPLEIFDNNIYNSWGKIWRKINKNKSL